MKKSVCLILLLFLVTSVFAGGGWPQPKGELYLKLNQWWIIYNEYYSVNGNLVKDRTRSIGTTSLYGEYGITNRVTAILYFPFFSKATLFKQRNVASGKLVAEGDEVTALGDLELTFKYGIVTDRKVVASLSLIMGVPLGESNGGYDGSLQTGDGEFNQMLRLDVSSSFKIGKLYPYVSVFGAINNRTEGFSDEYRLGTELGIKLGMFTPVFRLNMVRSLNNGSFNDALVGTNVSGNNTEYFTISPELIINFSKEWGLAFNYTKPLSGKLFFAEPSYSIGTFLKL